MSSKRNNRNRRNNFGTKSTNEATVRATGREDAYTIQTVEGTGGVLVPNSGVLSTTDTGGRYTVIVPDSLGVRISQLTRLYNQWKINRVVLKYIPSSYQMGSTSAAASTTTRMEGWFGVTRDPTVGLLVQPEIIEAGGFIMNFARRFQFSIPRTGWLYTQPRVGDTLSDNRFISPGILNFQSAFTGPATPIVLGRIEVNWDISCRYPIDSDFEVAARPPPLFGKALLLSQLENRLRLETVHTESNVRQCCELKVANDDSDTKSYISVSEEKSNKNEKNETEYIRPFVPNVRSIPLQSLTISIPGKLGKQC